MRELMPSDGSVSCCSSRRARWCDARSDAKRYRWAARSQSQIAGGGRPRRQMGSRPINRRRRDQRSENQRPSNQRTERHEAQSHIDKHGCRWSSTRLNHSSSTSDASHDELTSVVEHSERESHLTPPLDALQWTIFGPVTIQHQNRQIKITSHPRPIDSARARAGAAQLSHQTLRGFGSRPISRCGSVDTSAHRIRARGAFSPRSQPSPRCSSAADRRLSPPFSRPACVFDSVP